MLRKTRFNLPGIPQHVTQRNNNLELSPEKPDQRSLPAWPHLFRVVSTVE